MISYKKSYVMAAQWKLLNPCGYAMRQKVYYKKHLTYIYKDVNDKSHIKKTFASNSQRFYFVYSWRFHS